MSFFDRPNIYPPPQGKVKLQEFDNNDDRAFEHGIDGSGDYAVNKAAVLCFLCDNRYVPLEDGQGSSNRLIAFKGFVEDLQIKLNIEYTDEGGFNTVVKSKYLKNYNTGYSLVFNVIAHSVNDAISNANRFSELERIITYAFGPYNLGDFNMAYTVPNSYVFLSNLIGNGWIRNVGPNKTNININNEFVRKYGLRMAIGSIKMDPDLEMGTFQFNNKTYFKAFKVSMDIPIINLPFTDSYMSDALSADRLKTLMPYVLTSSLEGENIVNYYDYKQRAAFKENEMPANLFDARGFPFCILPKPDKILTSYDQGVRTYGANKHLKLGICINDSNITTENNPYITQNYCVFDAFLDSYSYEKKQEIANNASWSDPVATTYTVGQGGEISFNLSLNIPSYSVVDGEANCMKLNSLFRMIPISYHTKLPGGPVKVLLNNLIKDPNSDGSNGDYDFVDIYNNGLACNVASLNINIDNEQGFFEYEDFFIPKSMKLDLQLIIPHRTYGNLIMNKIKSDGTTTVETYKKDDSRKWPML